MPSNAVDTLPLAGSISHDLSIIGLFLQSDSIVKLLMLILLLSRRRGVTALARS